MCVALVLYSHSQIALSPDKYKIIMSRFVFVRCCFSTYHVDGLVGELDVQAVDISVGVDGNGLDTHLLGGPDDTASNLSSVCNQDLVKGL